MEMKRPIKGLNMVHIYFRFIKSHNHQRSVQVLHLSKSSDYMLLRLFNLLYGYDKLKKCLKCKTITS